MKCAIKSLKRCANRHCITVMREDTRMHEIEMPVERYNLEKGCFTYCFENVLVCENCYRNAGTCKSCGKKTMLIAARAWGEQNKFCLACDDSSIIFDAGTKNTPDFFNTDGKGNRKVNHVYMGVELEVSVDTDKAIGKTAQEVQECLGEFVFLKWDGSVPYGFEIVSQPALMDYHRSVWNDFFKMNEERGLLNQIDASCGMHVHVGRLGLNARSKHIYDRLSHLVFGRANREFMETVAGRANNNYASFNRNRGDKYQALNFSPLDTIEFRMFQSDVNRDVFLKNLEAVKAMVDYCSCPILMPKGSSNYMEFCKFVASNAQAYPFFHAFLTSKGFIKSVMEKPLFDWIMKEIDFEKMQKALHQKGVKQEMEAKNKTKASISPALHRITIPDTVRAMVDWSEPIGETVVRAEPIGDDLVKWLYE